MLYTDRYPVPTQQMSTDDLLAEATRLEGVLDVPAGADLDGLCFPAISRVRIDYNRYVFVRRELARRDVI
jgi:hypothetical protein